VNIVRKLHLYWDPTYPFKGLLQEGSWKGKPASIQRVNSCLVLTMKCEADLWCRKRNTLNALIDPSLFEIYLTQYDALDEEWIVQSNPPCAFQEKYVPEGCRILLTLLTLDPKLHATKGWLKVSLISSTMREDIQKVLDQMLVLVQTAERELKENNVC